MIVTPDLYTRLVILLGYTSRHQLFVTVVLLVFYLHTFSCYCYSVIYLSCYLVILWLQFILLLFCAHCYMHEFSSLHTHSPGRFLTTLDLHVQILDACFCCSGVRWDLTLREEIELLPIWFRYSYLLSFCYFLILDISDSVVIPVLNLYDIMRGCLYVILQELWFITVRIYSLFRLI